MPEPVSLDRLQPSLLDRVTDDDPHNKTPEARERRVIGKQRLRQVVLRDLAWLFNATRPPQDEGVGNYPYAARSVLNFGLPALAGETASTLDVLDLEARIREAIVEFEPRIDPAGLQVQALTDENQMGQHNIVSVQIHGSLWAQPVPLDVMLRTQLDLETGSVEILDITGAPPSDPVAES